MSKHRNASLTTFQTLPMFSRKCQRFRFEHPFTSMIAGMTGSGKTAWVRFLLQQASKTIFPPPERIVWCYSQWQPAYTQMLVAMPHIEFVKGIPTAFGAGFLFWSEQREFDRVSWSDDWPQLRQANCEPLYSWFSSSQSERDLYGAESISSGER